MIIPRPPSSTLFPYTTLFRSIDYWEAVQPDSPEYVFARRMVDTPKVVFSKTLTRVEGKNVRVESGRSEEHTSELQSPMYLVCRLLLEKKKKKRTKINRTTQTR